ncbi:MAG TPA: 1-acyl-sn-glycerol-3-phosphate acyltransferase [Vicinamibacterales bacterium]|nr:1-acyl-sn-glycerol-3-phosphate acyltransferase [Vicinamibacterales bacterium]
MRADDITRAVLARDDVARYLRGVQGVPAGEARQRIEEYLVELRTTQRYRFYRALQHPLYPILRKVRRVAEGIEHAADATRRGRVVYVSNHKSHLDYLVEPLVLDDHGVRPPLMAAGINLFGGALGLLHRHVTGAIPIRRNSKDPVYLVTLRAYVAEILKVHDLLYYAEGGRSYSGELKSPKTGLLQAALLADRHEISVVPMAVAYDLVLEDRIISRAATRKRTRPFGQEVAEMVRHAVGYQSRAFVTFGKPIALGDYDPEARRDLVALAHRIQDDIGRLYKVLPTALVAAAMRPQMTRAGLTSRIDELLVSFRAEGANLAVQTPQQAVDEGVEQLTERGVLVQDRQRLRIRDRFALRYYARTIEHLVTRRRGTTH